MRPGSLAAVVVLALAGVPAGVALGQGDDRDFEDPSSTEPSQQFAPDNPQREDTPNDRHYDCAEADDEDGTSCSSLYEERYDLFGFPSSHTRPTTRYREGPHATEPMISGFNAAGAWKITRGRADVTVSILDTGIRWGAPGLRRRIALNAGELPLPQDAEGQTDPEAGLDGYDRSGDGAVTVDDYEDDPRANPSEGSDGKDELLDAQDLIADEDFSDGDDDDDNGYVDDIAGWDFFDDDNDPVDSSSYFAARNHGTGRAHEAAEQADDQEGWDEEEDGQNELGVCPQCTLMPLRIWDTFVSDGNTFAMGIVYAADNGAEVVEGANGSLYHSAFAEAASRYAYDKGLAQVYSGDDLNTGNHNYPANYDHTMLIQGTAIDTIGLGADFGPEAASFLAGLGITLGTEAPVGTYFRGANTTQFGGHSSLAMEGATGSENTGKAAGAAGIVISAARERGIELSPDETRIILEQTAEDVTGGATGVDGNVTGAGAPDRAIEGWDMHFGWGRADVGEAVELAAEGDIPPEASIGDPDWYAPLAGAGATVRGRARARGDAFTWRLEWGPGLEPEESQWQPVGSGRSSGGAVTSFGTLPLGAIRAALEAHQRPEDPGQPRFSPLTPDPYEGQFTVRLVVEGEGIETPGVDRKVLTALEDETLREGFPRRLGTGGEAALRYADLDGDEQDELVVPLEDGTLHAYRPDGSELPGWPVRTAVMDQAAPHVDGSPGLSALPPAREPLRNPVVADLDDDGTVEVVTTAGDRIYAWNADGTTREGFPVELDRDNCRASLQELEQSHRKCGFLAGPAVGRFEGPDEPLSIVVPGLDQHLYGVRGDGSALPGFPRELVDPDEVEPMFAESINQPAVGDLNDDGFDDVVVATNEVYGAEPPDEDTIAGLVAEAFARILAGVTDTSSRLYAVDGRTGAFLPNWPIELDGGIQNVLPLIGPGHDAAIAEIGGEPRIVASTTGGSLSIFDVDGSRERSMQQEIRGAGSDAYTDSGALNLFESAVVGDVDGLGSDPDVVKYHVTLGQAANLVLVGQNMPYHHLIGAYDSSNGAPLAAWPRVTDDYQFLSSSTIADIGGSQRVVAGTGLGLLHAYDGLTGLNAPGFPKITGGWLFSPAALARDGRIAAITREGFLFEWTGEAAECQTEWPSFRHDQQSTGNYDKDGTPPGRVRDLSVTPLGDERFRVSFLATGDDGRCGAALRYELRSEGARATITPEGDPPEPGQRVTAEVSLGGGGDERAAARAGRSFALSGVDEAQNRGAPGRTQLGDGGSGGSGGGGGPDGGPGGGPGAGPGAPPVPGQVPPAGRGQSRQASCTPADGFRSVAVRPGRSGVELAFARRVARPVTVDVFQQSIGRRVIGERRVARFAGRTRSFRWRGRGRRVRDGYLFVRYTMALGRGRADVRRVAVRRVRGRFSVRPGFHTPDRCGLVRAFKLLRPVFGGRSQRSLGITFRLGREARAGVDVLRGGRVVRRYRPARRRAGLHRLVLSSRGLPRGRYAVRLEADGQRRVLSAARL